MRIVATVLALSILAVPAFAADEAPGQGRGAVREACKADIATLCPTAQPGGGQIRECLKTNKDKLSEGCKTAIAAAMQRRKERSSTAPAGQTPAPSTP